MFIRSHSSKTKQYIHSAEERPEVKSEDFYSLTEEERRLASSDLDDCEEVWIGDLSEYMLDTQKRMNSVENWFNVSVLVSRYPRSL